MEKAKKILAPMLAGGAAAWNAYGAVQAIETRHWLRGVFDLAVAVALAALAYALYVTGKRFSDS